MASLLVYFREFCLIKELHWRKTQLNWHVVDLSCSCLLPSGRFDYGKPWGGLQKVWTVSAELNLSFRLKLLVVELFAHEFPGVKLSAQLPNSNKFGLINPLKIKVSYIIFFASNNTNNMFFCALTLLYFWSAIESSKMRSNVF